MTGISEKKKKFKKRNNSLLVVFSSIAVFCLIQSETTLKSNREQAMHHSSVSKMSIEKIKFLTMYADLYTLSNKYIRRQYTILLSQKYQICH